MYCDADAWHAEKMARRYIGRYFEEIISHYELNGEHFAETKGYRTYVKAAEMLCAAGLEPAADAFVQANDWGTPQQILDRIEKRGRVLGGFNVSGATSYGGMPYSEVEKSMRLFSEKVLPELRSWSASAEKAEEALAAARVLGVARLARCSRAPGVRITGYRKSRLHAWCRGTHALVRSCRRESRTGSDTGSCILSRSSARRTTRSPRRLDRPPR